MDPLNPWLDPIEVRRMAERLLQRPSAAPAPVAEPGFGEAFVGFSPDSTVSAPQPFIFAAASAVPVFQGPPPATPDPVAAHGPFLERINRFRDWMRLNFAATEIFILDREGAVLYDESNHGRLHFLARSLALTSHRPGATGRHVHVKISAEATLEVIPVETPYDYLVLGAMVPESLNPPAVSAVMDALLHAASPPSDA